MSLLIDALKKASDARGLHHGVVTDSIADVAPDDYLGQKKAAAPAVPVSPPKLELNDAGASAAKLAAVPTRHELALTLEEIKPTENKISIDDRLAVTSTAAQIESNASEVPPAVSSESVTVTVPVQPAQVVVTKPAPASAESRQTPVAEPPKKPEAVQAAAASRASAVHLGASGARGRQKMFKGKFAVVGGVVALLASIGAASVYYYQQQMAALAFVPMVPNPGRLSLLQPLSPPPPIAEATVSQPATENSANVVPRRPEVENSKSLAKGPSTKTGSLSVVEAGHPSPSRKAAHADVNSPDFVPMRAVPIAGRADAQEALVRPIESGVGARAVLPVSESVSLPPVPVAELPGHSEPTVIAPQPMARAELREDSVETTLDKAYAAYRGGDWERATAAYQKALSSDRQNRDALLGMAAIAARNGDMAQSSDFYARLLTRDSKDAVALAGFVGVVGSLDPVRAQSELKTMMQQNPAAAFLHFALGNVYVAQSRWADAETEFFSASRMESTNPDYAYNLAISLDKLGQRDAALRYYKMALENAKSSTARFDLTSVEQRVKSIAAGAGRAGS